MVHVGSNPTARTNKLTGIGALQYAMAMKTFTATGSPSEAVLSAMPAIWNVTQHIKVYMYSDEGPHGRPHVHVLDGPSGDDASISIKDREVIVGRISPDLLEKVQAWIQKNEATLLQNWEVLVLGKPGTVVNFNKKKKKEQGDASQKRKGR